MDYPCHALPREKWCDRDGPGGFMGHTCVPRSVREADELQAHLLEHLNWGPLNGAEKVRFMVLALCGEAGELANLIKKDWRGDSGDRRGEIRAELADVGNYIFMIAAALNIDLPVVMLEKLKEVEQRPSWKAQVRR